MKCQFCNQTLEPIADFLGAIGGYEICTCDDAQKKWEQEKAKIEASMASFISNPSKYREEMKKRAKAARKRRFD